MAKSWDPFGPWAAFSAKSDREFFPGITKGRKEGIFRPTGGSSDEGGGTGSLLKRRKQTPGIQPLGQEDKEANGIPEMAEGGEMQSSHAIVGEKGPELLTRHPDGRIQITPFKKMKRFENGSQNLDKDMTQGKYNTIVRAIPPAGTRKEGVRLVQPETSEAIERGLNKLDTWGRNIGLIPQEAQAAPGIIRPVPTPPVQAQGQPAVADPVQAAVPPGKAEVLAKGERDRVNSIRMGGVVAPMTSMNGIPMKGSYFLPYPAGDKTRTDPAGDAAYAEYLKSQPAATPTVSSSPEIGRGAAPRQAGFNQDVINGTTISRNTYSPEGRSTRIVDLGVGREGEMYKEQQAMEREKLKDAGETERAKLNSEQRVAAAETRAQAQVDAAKNSGFQLSADEKSAFNPKTGKQISIGTWSQESWPRIENTAKSLPVMSDEALDEFHQKNPDLLKDAIDKMDPNFLPALLERLKKLKISVQ
jgi:hypothetical protein